MCLSVECIDGKTESTQSKSFARRDLHVERCVDSTDGEVLEGDVMECGKPSGEEGRRKGKTGGNEIKGRDESIYQERKNQWQVKVQ